MKDLKIKITDILTGETNIKIFLGECFLSTGFFDRNNKEIFEGDEIQYYKLSAKDQNFFGTVVWDKTHTGFAVKNGLSYDRLCDIGDPLIISSIGE